MTTGAAASPDQRSRWSHVTGRLRRGAKRGIRTVLPLAVRKRLAAWLGAQEWMVARHWWASELVRDLATTDPDAFHQFLWSHHLSYAESYEVARRFGTQNIHPSRRIFFDELISVLRRQGRSPETDVASVFEIGASVGHLLRYVEQEVFPGATTLEGIDIDEYAVRAGIHYLQGTGSRVRLAVGDAANLHGVLGRRRYDLLLCTGVLMYLTEQPAAAAVRTMLRHTDVLVALAGLAHPEIDNRELQRSTVRRDDNSFIHNFDRMVEAAGGRVVQRRWEGDRLIHDNSIYFVFAVPGRNA